MAHLAQDSIKALALGKEGLLHLRAGKYTKAIGLFNEALEHSGPNAQLYYGRALALLRLQCPDRALEDLERVLLAQPDNKDALEMRDALKAVVPPMDSAGFESVLCRELVESAAPWAAALDVPQLDSPTNRVALTIVEGAEAAGSCALVRCPDGRFLKDAPVHGELGDVLYTFMDAAADPIERSGEFMLLFGLWTDNPFHFMYEWMTRVMVAEIGGFKGTYLIPTNTFPRKALELVGITPDRLETWTGAHCRFERLYIAPRIACDCLHKFGPVTDALRNALLNGAGAKPADEGARIYVTRNNSQQGRQIVNEQDILEVLERFNFRRVAMEELPLAEQVRITAGASALVGPHGAGMMHCLVMPRCSFIVEFFSSFYVNPCFISVHRHLQHRYHMLVWDAVMHSADKLRNDVLADPFLLEMTLEQHLGVSRG